MTSPVLVEYITYCGSVLEHHIADASTQAVFEQTFSVSRFRTTFDVPTLPLLVGLDFEWKPDRAGQNNPISVMQFACWDTVFLLRMSDCLELPPWLTDFLESDGEIVKITASFDIADKQKLQSSFKWDFDIKAFRTSFCDIAELAAAREIPQGMLKMAHHLKVPFQKLKSVGTSDWDSASRKGLTSEQREYAANDAFFQLYLFGRLLQLPPTPDRTILDSWNTISPELEARLRLVENSGYYKGFMALRNVLKDAIDVLSRSLGSGGCTNLNALNHFKPVQAALKTAPVQLNAHFLRQNSDIFVCFFRDGELRVRLRTTESDDEMKETSLSDSDDAAFISQVQGLLAAYEPPARKKRRLEAVWVPGRAILTRAQLNRLERCSRNCLVETSYDSEDGVLLRLARHPRAPDDVAYMDSNVCQLCEDLDIDAADAKQRLEGDEKFMQYWSLLRRVEAKSEEEHAISRNLRARSRILADAHRLALRLSSQVSLLQ